MLFANSQNRYGEAKKNVHLQQFSIFTPKNEKFVAPQEKLHEKRREGGATGSPKGERIFTHKGAQFTYC